jgi:hypothetical protein
MLKFLKSLFAPNTLTKEEIAHEFAIWAWGKKVPMELTDFQNFFLRFLDEKGIDIKGKRKY